MAIIRALVVCSAGSGGSGSARVPISSLRSALARASGSPVTVAPDASAWYSRDRLIAIWIIPAATGPRISTASAPSGPGPSSSLLRPIGTSQAR